MPETGFTSDAWGAGEVLFADRVRSCEDVVVVPSQGLAITACDVGRERWNDVMGFFKPRQSQGDHGGDVVEVEGAELFIFRYAAKDGSHGDTLTRMEIKNYPDGEHDLKTLGLAFDESTSTLYLCNHRRAGPPRIEMFRINGLAEEEQQPTATWLRSVQHPLIHMPNSIAIAPNDKDGCTTLYITNDHYFLVSQTRLLAMLETYLSLPLGTVVRVDVCIDDNPTATTPARVVARLPYPNGIETLHCGSIMAVASTSGGSVYLYDVDSNDTDAWTYRAKINVPFMPDNLAVPQGEGDGHCGYSLLIAGHPHVPTMSKFAGSRWLCNDAAELAALGEEESANTRAQCEVLTTGSWVVEWRAGQDEDGGDKGSLRTLYSGTGYPTSASAAWDTVNRVGIVSGLYAKGLLVWR